MGIVAALLLVPVDSGAQTFCTIAGGCEPVAAGTLEIAFDGPSGKPEPAPFTVYPEKALPVPENAVATGRAGSAVELIVGRYDVALHSQPSLWERGVAIAENRATRLSLGGYGRLVVSGAEAASRDVVVYPAGAKRVAGNVVTVGKTGQPLSLLAGVYDVKAAMNPDVWFEKVRVARGSTSELRSPEAAGLLVTVGDADGRPLSENVWLYAPGRRNDVVASGRTNAPFRVRPGLYDVRVPLAPTVWFEAVEVAPGRTIKLDVPPRGRVLVTMRDARGKPVNERYWLYPPGKSSDAVTTGKAGQPVAVGPGAYDVWTKVGGKEVRRRVEIKPGQTTTLEIALE